MPPPAEPKIQVTRPYYSITVGIPAAVVRSYKQPLYDTELARTALPNADMIFFSKPIGQNLADGTTQKTLLHTNMRSAGALGVPLSFDLFGFNVRVPKDITLSDFRSFYARGVFEYSVGQDTIFLQVPVEDVPSGVDTEGLGSTDVPHVGWGVTDNYYRFDVTGRALHINSQENFQVKIFFPSAGVTLTADRLIRVYKRGILYKGL